MDRIEFVRRAVAASWRSDPNWASMPAYYAEDHVMFTRTAGLDGGGWRGADGFRRWLGEVAEGLAWDSSLREVEELDERRVLAFAPTNIRGRLSGIAFDDFELVAVLTFDDDGKICRTSVHDSREEALAAG